MMERAKISVAMTTYNGSKYIVQLLDSLRLQEVKPDEVLIADDCSRDNTVEIVKNYIKNMILPDGIFIGIKKYRLAKKF
jgi:Glycosyl transferase family 2